MSAGGRRYLTGHEKDRLPEHSYLAVLENGGPRASPHRYPIGESVSTGHAGIRPAMKKIAYLSIRT